MTNAPSPTTDATMKEKLEALFNEQKLRNAQRHSKDASTFQSRAISEADEVRGRFAQINKSDVVGSTPTPEYPRLPDASPWHHDPVPAEECLGIDVNALEPVGTEREIEASLGDGSPSVAQSDGATTETEQATQEARSVAPSSPIETDLAAKRRRL